MEYKTQPPRRDFNLKKSQVESVPGGGKKEVSVFAGKTRL